MRWLIAPGYCAMPWRCHALRSNPRGADAGHRVLMPAPPPRSPCSALLSRRCSPHPWQCCTKHHTNVITHCTNQTPVTHCTNQTPVRPAACRRQQRTQRTRTACCRDLQSKAALQGGQSGAPLTFPWHHCRVAANLLGGWPPTGDFPAAWDSYRLAGWGSFSKTVAATVLGQEHLQ